MAVEVIWTRGQTTRIALCLRENVLRSECELLRFDNADDLSVDTQSIIGGSVVRGILLDRAMFVGAKRPDGVERHNGPARSS